VSLQREEIIGDGSCYFSALGITRAALADAMIDCLDNKHGGEARSFIQEELFSYISCLIDVDQRFQAWSDKNLKNTPPMEQTKLFVERFIRPSTDEFVRNSGNSIGGNVYTNYIEIEPNSEFLRPHRVGTGLGRVVASLLQRKIYIVSQSNIGRLVYSFSPKAIDRLPVLQSSFYENEFWVLHSGNHFDRGTKVF
jgi:hypothetical protein